nr:carbonic anhydrase 5-like protein [Tridacna squamosa]
MDSSLLLGVFSVFCLTALSDAANWGYIGEKGVDSWADLFPDACAGQSQSPIDIVTSQTVYDPNLKDFAIFYDPPLPGSKFLLHNNGHAIQVDTQGKFHVSNGGLRYLYNTAQFHFHWGHRNHVGSEHTIDGKAAPIELHIVNWNSDEYKSIAEAVTEPEGLAVLGMLFEVSQEDNEALEPLVKALLKVRDPDKKVKTEIPAVSMRHYLPAAPERFYRYNGSLTTPGCFESVVWTVFHHRLPISRRQLQVFRQVLKPKKHKRSLRSERRARRELLAELGIEHNLVELERLRRNLEEKQAVTQIVNKSDGTVHKMPKAESQVDPTYSTHGSEHGRVYLVNNYRPVQPLYGRTVYRSFPFFDAPIEKVRTVYVEVEKENKKGKESGASAIASLSLVTIASIILAQFFI